MTGSPLPMFPLSAVLFPQATIPLHVFEARYRAMTRQCLEADHRFGVVLIERGSEVGGGDQRSSLGTRGLIVGAVGLADGRWLLRVRGEVRIRVVRWLPDDPYPLALVEDADHDADPADQSLVDLVRQRVRRARAVLAEHGGGPPLPPDAPLGGDDDTDATSWQLCAAAPIQPYDAQRLLARDGSGPRLTLLLELLDDLEDDLRRMLASE